MSVSGYVEPSQEEQIKWRNQQRYVKLKLIYDYIKSAKMLSERYVVLQRVYKCIIAGKYYDSSCYPDIDSLNDSWFTYFSNEWNALELLMSNEDVTDHDLSRYNFDSLMSVALITYAQTQPELCK